MTSCANFLRVSSNHPLVNSYFPPAPLSNPQEEAPETVRSAQKTKTSRTTKHLAAEHLARLENLSTAVAWVSIRWPMAHQTQHLDCAPTSLKLQGAKLVLLLPAESTTLARTTDCFQPLVSSLLPAFKLAITLRLPEISSDAEAMQEVHPVNNSSNLSKSGFGPIGTGIFSTQTKLHFLCFTAPD